MSRFKDLCSSSDSDEEVQRGPVQRGRVRQTKRFTQIKPKNSDEEQTAQIIIPKKAKLQKQPIKPVPEQDSLEIQTNELKDLSSVNASQKFIRQQIKPIQQHLQHFLDKMQDIKTDRKKFTNALTAASRDLEKVTKRITELKSQEIKQKHSSDRERNSSGKDILRNTFSQKVKIMEELQAKIINHMTKMMTQHDKTIEMMTQCRKDMDRTFQKVKFLFLDLKRIDIYNQEKDEYEEFGIVQVYKILESADALVDEITSFSK